MDKKPLVIIAGPTAVGKTAASIKLAKEINGEIISGDSMQVYKTMDIGTAKVMPDEMDGVKHYMIDELNPDDEFSVFKFKQRAKKYIDEIYAKGKVPIIVGGTGFYIQSIIYDIEFEDVQTNFEYREELEKDANEYGNDYIHNKLKGVDEKAAELIHPNNRKRVIRALEFFKTNNEKISDHNEKEKSKITPYNLAFFVLTCNDRNVLYDRINLRVDIMKNGGLIEEVKDVYSKYDKSLVSMQGIGYKEIIEYLDGSLALEESLELLKKNTRNFAKRQVTWFKREKDARWIETDLLDFDKDKITNKMLEILEEKGIYNA